LQFAKFFLQRTFTYILNNTLQLTSTHFFYLTTHYNALQHTITHLGFNALDKRNDKHTVPYSTNANYTFLFFTTHFSEHESFELEIYKKSKSITPLLRLFRYIFVRNLCILDLFYPPFVGLSKIWTDLSYALSKRNKFKAPYNIMNDTIHGICKGHF